MSDPTLAAVKLVLDLLESNRAPKATGWTRFRGARTTFCGMPTSDNWASLAVAADELQAAIAAGRSGKPTPRRRASDSSRPDDRRRGAVTDAARRIRATLAAVLVQAEAPELALAHRWLDNWHGVGLLAVGLHRTGYDLDLRQYGDGHWRASFFVTGLAHSILGGSAWEPTVWRAVQRAGWDAMKHAERNL
jgi:hypothetical protein